MSATFPGASPVLEPLPAGVDRLRSFLPSPRLCSIPTRVEEAGRLSSSFNQIFQASITCSSCFSLQMPTFLSIPGAVGCAETGSVCGSPPASPGVCHPRRWSSIQMHPTRARDRGAESSRRRAAAFASSPISSTLPPKRQKASCGESALALLRCWSQRSRH